MDRYTNVVRTIVSHKTTPIQITYTILWSKINYNAYTLCPPVLALPL